MTELPDHVHDGAMRVLGSVEQLSPVDALTALHEAISIILADSGCDDHAVTAVMEVTSRMVPSRVRELRAVLLARAH